MKCFNRTDHYAHFHQLLKSFSSAAEHFYESGRSRNCCSFLRTSEFPYQPLLIYGANLIQRDLAGFSLEAHSNSTRIHSRDRRHGCDHYGLQMQIHLVG